MKRILLVKTSSLGDVVHNLPAASDIRRHFPEARIDWVVEEAYAPVVELHPAVTRAIPVALRRWRRHLLGAATWTEVGEFRRLSRAEQYDAVIDTQGLVKSALMSRAARGRHHGFDAGTAREPLAARFYDVTHHVTWAHHAVERNRLLVGAALGFRAGDRADYGLTGRLSAPAAAAPYCVLLHGSARAEKLWAEASWVEIGRRLSARGLGCVLPWGSEDERARSLRLAQQIDGAAVPPLEPLDRLAASLAGAAAVIGVDTGLTHLAAALGRPVVATFCGTDVRFYGIYAAPRARNLGGPGVPPSAEEVLRALDAIGDS
jgi:heptosyltransferase I